MGFDKMISRKYENSSNVSGKNIQKYRNAKRMG